MCERVTSQGYPTEPGSQGRLPGGGDALGVL